MHKRKIYFVYFVLCIKRKLNTTKTIQWHIKSIKIINLKQINIKIINKYLNIYKIIELKIILSQKKFILNIFHKIENIASPDESKIRNVIF